MVLFLVYGVFFMGYIGMDGAIGLTLCLLPLAKRVYSFDQFDHMGAFFNVLNRTTLINNSSFT